MARFTLVLPALLLFALALPAQQQPSTPTTQKTPTYAAIPVEAINQPNPVKSSPESLSRAKKWWTLDCAMCHGADGKASKAGATMGAKDFQSPDVAKQKDADWIETTTKGKNKMPAFDKKLTADQIKDLIKYIRTLK